MAFTLVTSLVKNTIKAVQVPQNALAVLAMSLGLYNIVWPPNANVRDGTCYDYIIIGSGAGAVVASRLTEDPNVSVLLIEAGKTPSIESMLAGLFVTLQNSYQDWNFKSEPELATQSQSDNVFKLSAGKCLGGSSQMNHFIYLRGSPIDFDTWAKITNDSSWNYDAVLPYFIKSETMKDKDILSSEYEKYCGKDGPIAVTRELYTKSEKYLKSFAEAGQEQKINLNGRETYGYAEVTLNNDVVRQSIPQVYIKPIAKRKNLHVMYESVATKINFDDNKNAISVDILVGGKIVTVKACKEIIVAGGVYNTPKLLMLSGIGPENHLKTLNIPVVQDLPVGQNLQDHVAVPIVQKMERSLEILSEIPALTSIGFPVIIGAARINKNVDYPEYQTTNLVIPHDSPILAALCTQIFGYKSTICEEFIKKCIGRNTIFSIVGLIDPRSRGSVTLRSTDPSDDPIIKLNFYSDPLDEDAMVEYIQNFLLVQNTTYFRSVNSEPIKLDFDDCEGDFTSKDYIRCYVRHTTSTLYHQTSTCPMGTVVDSKLNVLGVNRLRIVDASIMPIVTRANTLASTIMIAEKASDMIKDAQAQEECLCVSG